MAMIFRFWVVVFFILEAGRKNKFKLALFTKFYAANFVPPDPKFQIPNPKSQI